MLGNDTDVDSATLTAALVSGPSNGALSLNADGSFSYTPNADFNGTDSFTYLANDGALDSNTATVNITVNAVNDAPVAADDAYPVDEDDPLNVARWGAGQRHRRRQRHADCGAGERPEQRHAGAQCRRLVQLHARMPTSTAATPSPTRPMTAGLDSNVATVTITVNAVNDAPVAADDAYRSTRTHADRGRDRGPCQRHRVDRRHADRGAGDRPEQRYVGAECRRLVHLHA